MLSVDLPPEPASAARARALARERFATHCSRDTLDTIALLVTELVTNAILHARTMMQLTLDVRPGLIRISVEDESNDQPTPQHYAADAVTGRGLALVEQLASSWGVESTPTGKLVWCNIST